MCQTNPIRVELEKARKQLLDLTSRNRLLNTRRSSTRSSRLEIMAPESEEVFRVLVREKRPMTFLAAKRSEKADDREEPTDQELFFQQPQEAESAKDEAAARHTDDRLQTTLPPEALQKRLLRLFLDARTAEEEQGANILYLALGFLRWYEDEHSDLERQAPLLLIPVTLDRRSVRSRFAIRYADEGEVATNLSLQEMLGNKFGITLPEVPDVEALSPCEYFKAVEDAVASQPKWVVLRDDMVVWLFSFAKSLMYRDLGPDIWPEDSPIEDHPLVKGLLHDGFAKEAPIFPNVQQIDDVLQPLDAMHVLNADSSQTEVIEEVKRRRNLVVHGPPGTGKSQTIANIMAAAVADGRTVLFLAEKMAALEVVKRYLDNIGLGQLCLELHSRKANKRHVVEEINGTLTGNQPVVDGVTEQAADLKKTLDELNRHARAIHARHKPSCLTPYQVIGELVRLRARGIRGVGFELESPTLWSPSQFRDKRNLLADLASYLAPIGNPRTHPCRGIGLAVILPADIDRLVFELNAIIPRLDGLTKVGAELAAALNVSPPTTAAEIEILERFAQWYWLRRSWIERAWSMQFGPNPVGKSTR